MMERIRRSKYRKSLAIALIALGIVALLVPGLPGAWFALIGLEILGIRLLWGERLKAWIGAGSRK